MRYALLLVLIFAFVQAVDDWFELRRNEGQMFLETIARCIPPDSGATTIYRTGMKLQCNLFSNIGYGRAPKPIQSVEVVIGGKDGK